MSEPKNTANITVWAFVGADGKTPVAPALGARLWGYIHGRDKVDENTPNPTSATNSVDPNNPLKFGTISKTSWKYVLKGTPSGAYVNAMRRLGVELNLERPLDSVVREDATASVGDGTVTIAPGTTRAGARRPTSSASSPASGGAMRTRRASPPPESSLADGELDLASLAEEGDGTAEAAVEPPPLANTGVRKTLKTDPAAKTKHKKSRAGLWWLDFRNWGALPPEEKPKLSIPVGARKDKLGGSPTPPPKDKA